MCPAAPPPATGPVTRPIPTASDRPILAFFDVDNTLMRGTSLFQLGREAMQRRLITWRQLLPFAWHQLSFIRKGENDAHLASAKERALGLAGGFTQEQVGEIAEHIWEHRIKGRLYAETVALAQEHIAKGHEVWLLSATPVEIGALMARHLGLTGALGTRVEVVDGVYTGRLVGSVLHKGEKAVAARELAERAGADLADCWAYSDSRNDLPLLEAVGNPTVVNPDAILAIHALRHEWPVLLLTPRSIKEAQRRVRRRARDVRRRARRAEPEGGAAAGD